jgi:hypothetical protein
MCLEEKKKFTKRRAYSSLENNAIHGDDNSPAEGSPMHGSKFEESDQNNQKWAMT